MEGLARGPLGPLWARRSSLKFTGVGAFRISSLAGFRPLWAPPVVFNYRPPAAFLGRRTSMHMRIYSWSVALGIVGLSAAAAVGCSSSSTTGSTGDDASTEDAPTTTPEPDAATDTGTTAPTPDGSTAVTEG